MAEYYPLLSRAVSGLRDAPPEKRRAIYDRARQALIGQLQSMEQANPALIDRESKALDEAIAQVEAEIGISAAANAPIPEPAAQAAAPKRPAPPNLPPRPAPSGPALRDRTGAATPRPFAVPPRPSATPRPQPTIPIPRTDLETERDDAAILPAAPRLQVKSFEAGDVSPPRAFDAGSGPVEASPQPVAASRVEAARPVAPSQPVVRERFTARGLIVALIAMLAVGSIAYTAWRLRDRPEVLARARAALEASRATEPQPDKVSNRADGGAAPPTAADAPSSVEASPPPNATSPAEATPQVATPVAPATLPSTDQQATQAQPQSSPPEASTPSSAPDALPAAQPSPDAPSQAQPAAAAPAATGTEPVFANQRAAFLVDAPDDPAKVKTYVGTVVWTTESVSPGQGQPLTTAIKADVDVPDADLKLSMLIQKNVEAQFPASHTIELRFTPTAGNTLGAVKQINVPQMRKDDMPTGDSLAGLPVTITENYFLVGLSRGDVVARNLDLLQSRNWIDVPCLLASGKIAKITFEKGTQGDKLLGEAIQSWQ